jgi:hypothetical protein
MEDSDGADGYRLPFATLLTAELSHPPGEGRTRARLMDTTCPFARHREGREVHVCVARPNIPVMVSKEFALPLCATQGHVRCARFVEAATIGQSAAWTQRDRIGGSARLERPATVRLAQVDHAPVQHDAFAHSGNRRNIQPSDPDTLVENVPSQTRARIKSTPHANSVPRSPVGAPAPTTTNTTIEETRIYVAPDPQSHRSRRGLLAWIAGVLSLLVAALLAVALSRGLAQSSSVPPSKHRVVSRATAQQVLHGAVRAPASAWSFTAPRGAVDEIRMVLNNPGARAADAMIQPSSGLPTEVLVPAGGSVELRLGRAQSSITVRSDVPILPQLVLASGGGTTSRYGTPLRGAQPGR